MKKDIYFLGDIHGAWSELCGRIAYFGLTDCIIICVGDFGIGFRDANHSYELDMQAMNDLNTLCKDRDIEFYSIRGNHDDPRYFNDPEYQVVLSNVQLLEDYATLNINGLKFLFVGGAHSIDKHERITEDDMYGIVSYWPDEPLVFDTSKMCECDVLVTHTAPTWNGPFNKSCFDMTTPEGVALHTACCEERLAVDRLIRATMPRLHYCGHFHTHSYAKVDGAASRILDINEIQLIQSL